MAGPCQGTPAGVPSDSGRPHLQNLEVGQPVGPVLAAVLLHVFDPLDVGLGIAVHFADKLHVAPDHRGGVGGQPGLEDGPVRGSLCGETGEGRDG